MAVVAAVVVAALSALVAGALDLFVASRLLGQTDARLGERLTSLSQGQVPTSSLEDDEVDGTPTYVWRAKPPGRLVPISPRTGAPPLPYGSWSASGPVTVKFGGRELRVAAVRQDGGWLVAAESVTDLDRVRNILLTAELLGGTALVVVTFAGALLVGLKASAPIEAARQRQLEFTADASHELRTPLSVIQAEVSLALSRPRDTASYTATLERVNDESHRLRRIVDDLLWLARQDAEPAPPGGERTDLAEAAETSVARFSAVAAERSIRLRHEATATDPAVIQAPRDWVERLLGVLVDNACRYSGEGATVSVTTGERPSGRVYLRVDDTGPGIPPAQRHKIFDRFHRGTEQPGGAGLGLAIADSVVRRTSGRWHIGTADGGGARLEISWPASSGSPPAPAPPPLATEGDRASVQPR